jgi:lipopolysaccharide transport protein LptA
VLCVEFRSNAEIKPLKGIDNLEIEADTINTVRDKGMVIFNGNVIAKQIRNNLELHSIEMNLKYGIDKEGKIFMRKLYAFGNVVLKRGEMTITGKECLYDIIKNEIIMKNDVVLFDNISKVNGDTVIYNVENDNAQVLGKEEESEQVTIILEDTNKAKEVYGKQK